MNKEIIKKVVRDFHDSGDQVYEEHFIIEEGRSKYKFKVRVEREESVIFDSIATESFVSALPSGEQCPRCKGAGTI